MVERGSKGRAAIMAAMLTVAAGSAWAQQAGGNIGTGTESGASARREGSRTQQQEMKLERQGTRTTTVPAPGIIWPAITGGVSGSPQSPELSMCLLQARFVREGSPAFSLSNPKEGAAKCIGVLASLFVTGSQRGWPRNAAPRTRDGREWVALATAGTVTVTEFAAEAAKLLNARAVKDQGEAQAQTRALLLDRGTELFTHFARRWGEYERRFVTYNLDGKCGQSWTIELEDGPATFCGDREPGFVVKRYGTTWLSGDTIAGAKVEVALGETAATTTTTSGAAISATTTTTGATSSGGLRVGQ